ncbi:MAG: hypothetical protein K2V38_01635 [Gemmataceae bacterium]|nr:hypothetical protein [Gemmataceae bacterium]
MSPRKLHQCPCCDYFTLEERVDYEICPVCFWEDDGTDLGSLDAPSGPNPITLREARENFRRLGACEAAMLEHVCTPAERARYRRERRPD